MNQFDLARPVQGMSSPVLLVNLIARVTPEISMKGCGSLWYKAAFYVLAGPL